MTENNIYIDKEALLHEVHLRNHYMGEAVKRNDINADVIQSSEDDEELLEMFLERACNELVSSFAMRFPHIMFTTEREYIQFNIAVNDAKKAKIIPFLQQAIKDYLVNELALQWMLLRSPQMAQSYISLREQLYQKVQQHLAKLCKYKIRRRSTDLAGI